MSKIEKVKAEIERRIKKVKECLNITPASVPIILFQEFEDLLSFINSLEEEPVSKFDSCIQEGDKIVANEDGTRFNVSQLERVAVSEDLEEWEKQYLEANKDEILNVYDRHAGLVDGANWQKEQMLKDAIVRYVRLYAGGYPYVSEIELYDYDKDVPLAKEGDKVKVIVIKEVENETDRETN